MLLSPLLGWIRRIGTSSRTKNAKETTLPTQGPVIFFAFQAVL
jgi:hypothetical protein